MATLPSTRTLVVSVPVIVLAQWLLKLYLGYKRIQRCTNYHPGRWAFLSRSTYYWHVAPDVPPFKWGWHARWVEKFKPFFDAGAGVACMVGIWPEPRADFLIADPVLFHQIARDRTTFPKPVKSFRAVTYFGSNILGVEGEDHKRHRKLLASSFSERNVRLVWDVTVDIVQQLFQLWAAQGNEDLVVVDPSDITYSIALFAISRAGFGKQVSWDEQDVVPPGYTISFKDALLFSIQRMGPRVALPDWLLSMTQWGRETIAGLDDYRKYLQEMIDERKALQANGQVPNDVLSNIVALNEDHHDGNDMSLSDEEMQGTCFALQGAGHETTAHALDLVFRLLALYPEVQEELYRNIQAAKTDGAPITYADVPKLSYALAVIYETLRMFPITGATHRIAEYDTTLKVERFDGRQTIVLVPKHSSVSFSIVGMHYDPRHWDEPYEFRPQRFLRDYDKQSFAPFLSGPHACIGRRFSEIEMLAVLSTVLDKYRIEVTVDPKYEFETGNERKARVLATQHGILTLIPCKTSLTFKRR